MDIFEKESLLERKHLKESNLLNIIIDKMNQLNYEHVNHYISYSNDLDIYDCSMTFRNEDAKYFRVLIEVKVRHTDYDEYFLEEKKYNHLINYSKSLGSKVKIFYVNFCPSKTHIWELKDDMTPYKKEKRQCKKYTSVDKSKIEYINKIVYLMPTSKSMKIDYHHSEIKDTLNTHFIGQLLNQYDVEVDQILSTPIKQLKIN